MVTATIDDATIIPQCNALSRAKSAGVAQSRASTRPKRDMPINEENGTTKKEQMEYATTKRTGRGMSKSRVIA